MSKEKDAQKARWSEMSQRLMWATDVGTELDLDIQAILPGRALERCDGGSLTRSLDSAMRVMPLKEMGLTMTLVGIGAPGKPHATKVRLEKGGKGFAEWNGAQICTNILSLYFQLLAEGRIEEE